MTERKEGKSKQKRYDQLVAEGIAFVLPVLTTEQAFEELSLLRKLV